MQVIVSLEHRFVRTPDGQAWSKTMFAYPFWQRYLEVFDSVKIVARIRDVAEVDSSWKKVTGSNVQFHPIPYYHGPKEFFLRYFQVRRAVRAAYDPKAAFILRVGSALGGILISLLKSKKHPFGLEVVGDPWDVFAPGAIRHPLRPLIRIASSHRLCRQCREAAAIAYVTEFALQRRYPSAKSAFTTHYSSVELPPEAFTCKLRTEANLSPPYRIITVGSMETMYKGFDILIDAVAQCRTRGLPVKLEIIGDGKHRKELEQQTQRLGINNFVHFTGQVTAGTAVRERLDSADLFVLASRTEGLPRALIEAMARGLPCIASKVGGIPELLDDAYLVVPNNSDLLTQILIETFDNPGRMAHMSTKNYRTATNYCEDLLMNRRREFFTFIRDRFEGADSGVSALSSDPRPQKKK